MSRVQLALNVDDLDEAVTFYSKLFNTAPAKVKPGYANFAVAEPPLKLVLLDNPGKGGTINHLGVEVESSDKVHAEIARLSGEGLFTDEEIGTTCCFATQDKVWVTGPPARSGRSTPCSPTPRPSAPVRSGDGSDGDRLRKQRKQQRPAASRSRPPRPWLHGRGRRIIGAWTATASLLIWSARVPRFTSC